MKDAITVQAVVNAPIEKVWEYWNKPEHITQWAFASDDWQAPRATNDLRVGGKFMTRMESRDGTEGFDFGGTYTAVEEHRLIEYDMNDPAKSAGADRGAGARHVKVEFAQVPGGVKITETFDPENENPEEVQRSGWQSILNNFKKYAERTT